MYGLFQSEQRIISLKSSVKQKNYIVRKSLRLRKPNIRFLLFIRNAGHFLKAGEHKLLGRALLVVIAERASVSAAISLETLFLQLERQLFLPRP